MPGAPQESGTERRAISDVIASSRLPAPTRVFGGRAGTLGGGRTFAGQKIQF